jgi:hypothetical protein
MAYSLKENLFFGRHEEILSNWFAAGFSDCGGNRKIIFQL